MFKSKKSSLPVAPADILIPGKDIDPSLFAVVACDQFTQDRDYWERVYELRSGVPSAAHIMLPEVYLNDGQEEVDRRIGMIKENMRSYIDHNIFDVYKNTMILTRRTFSDGRIRTGLVAAIDLEQYDYTPGSGTAVRATEATVIERIPPRVRIRRGSPLEMPHIMILIDDPGKTVIEPLDEEASDDCAAIYDFDLLEGGGKLKGFALDRRKCKKVLFALEKLADKDDFCRKYDLSPETPVLLLAIGDGNHSLASAKALYEETHSPEHRYALAEIVNIHSPGIVFEPIHRILLGVDSAEVERSARTYFGDDLIIRETEGCGSHQDAGEMFKIRYIADNIDRCWFVSSKRHLLSAGAIQDFIDAFISSHPGSSVDYIHGDNEAASFGRRDRSCAFILEAMPKSDLFKTVIKNGALPRKTFSMGNAEEKRYYFECRRIG